MTAPLKPYAQWRQDNYLKLMEDAYAIYGCKIDEYADFAEAEYRKAQKAHLETSESPSP